MRKLADLPNLPGVYIMKDRYGRVIYVGKAKNLKKRVSSYFVGLDRGFKVESLRFLIDKIEYIICDSEKEALIIERKLISEFKPFFNVLWKDSKTYPYIVLTKEDFPRILITRKKEIDGIYFGPYPKTDFIKRLIEHLEDIGFSRLRKCKYNFSIKNKLQEKYKNKCLYYHTEQCLKPCDNMDKKKYYKNVRLIIDFLKGRHKKLLDMFEKKMRDASQNYEYEQALRYRDFIYAINHIYEKITFNETDYESLKSKIDTTQMLINLKNILNLSKIPYHIESFDISNILNKWICGSSVCFINGTKNHSHYRHYKIRFNDLKGIGGNDYEMIYEIVKRRILRAKEENCIPDLLLIDGGKGQLNMAKKALDELGVKIDVISLAKKNEEIYLVGLQSPIVLDKDLKELLFLMSIRDETHRFAIGYHRRLRSKEFLL